MSAGDISGTATLVAGMTARRLHHFAEVMKEANRTGSMKDDYILDRETDEWLSEKEVKKFKKNARVD